MTFFQLILFALSAFIFYIFFKKLFSEDYPKRGIDFEAKKDNAQIGGINRPDKTFSEPTVEPTRLEQLIAMTDEAVGKGDLLEAKKAIQSALIVDKESSEVISRYAYILNESKEYEEAKEYYQKAIELNPEDDMLYASCANVLHKLGEETNALEYHQKSIELDAEYAPHYYNYANTQYDQKEYTLALELYEKALTIDPKLAVAQEMITKIKTEKSL